MNNRILQLQKMYESDPEDTFVIFALAKEYQQNEAFDQALEFYLKLKEIDHEYVGMYYHLAKTFETIEDHDKAITAYKEGIEIARKQQDHHAEAELKNALMNLELEL